MKQMKKLVVMLALGACLAACGFHLRGSYHMDPALKQLQVATPANSPIRQELLLALQTVGVDTEHDGELRLVIDHENLIKQTSAVNSAAKAAEYTLIYDVQYRVRYASGHAATYPRNLYLRRSYQYDPTSVVGKSTEEETLISELHSDAVQQIVRQLSALRPDKLLPDADPASLPVAPADSSAEAPLAPLSPLKPALPEASVAPAPAESSAAPATP